MPFYTIHCPKCGRCEDIFRYVDNRDDDLPICHGWQMQRLLPTPMIHVDAEICYESPIDGRPITTKQARIEDLKRSDCVEWEPTLRAHTERRNKADDEKLEKKIDETVEREISAMPTRKRELLESELRAGADADYTRITPQQQSRST